MTFDLCSLWAIDAEVGAIGVAAHATVMTQIGFALRATNDAAVLSLSSGQMSTRRATVSETQSRRQLCGGGYLAARMQLLDLVGSHHVGSPGSLGSSIPADGSSESEFPCSGKFLALQLETLRQRSGHK